MIPDYIEKEAIERCCQFLQNIHEFGKPIPRKRVHKVVGLYQTAGFTAKTLTRLLWVEYLRVVDDLVSLTPQGLKFLKLPREDKYRKLRSDWRKFIRTKTCDKCGKKSKRSLTVFRGQFLCGDCLNPAAEKPDYTFYRQYSVFDTAGNY